MPTTYEQLEQKYGRLMRENDRLHEALTAANHGDVPAGWDAAIERAEKAEQQVATLRTQLAEARLQLSQIEQMPPARTDMDFGNGPVGYGWSYALSGPGTLLQAMQAHAARQGGGA